MALQNAPNEYFTNIDYNPSFYESTSTSEYDLLYLKKTGIATSTAVTTFSNSVVVPTMILSDSSTNVSTTAFVKNQLYATLSSVITSINNIFSGTNIWTGTNSFNNVIISANKILTLNTGAIISANGIQVSDINLSYLNGATSNIQYQIDNYLNVQHGWTALQVFRMGANILAGKTLELGTSSDISTNGVSISDVELSYLNNTSSNIQSQINAIIQFSTSLINTWTDTNTFNKDIFVNGIRIGQGTSVSGNNLCVGGSSLIQATNTGVSNIAIGTYCELSITSGSYNNACGYGANEFISTGNYNTALGYLSQQNNSTGSFNVGIGNGANQANLQSANTAVGCLASQNNNGQFNTALGYCANYQTGSTTFSNTTCLGYNTKPTANNQVIIGTSSESTIIDGNLSISGISNFNNIVYFDSSKANTSITNIFDSLQCYGINGISFNCGGTNNTNSTSSFTFSSNYLLSTSPILCSDSISSGNSFLSPYLNTYNNYPLLTSPLISNVQTANLTNLTATVKTQSTIFTSDNLCSILYPKNSNQSINISIPISSGVQNGTFGPSSIGTFKSNNVLSNYNFLIYNGAILIDTIPGIMISGGVLSSVFNGTCNALAGTTNWNYQQFMSNFSLAYTPPISTSSITYNIKFQCTLTLTVTYTGTISILSGLGYMKFNTLFSGNANSSAGFSLGAVTTNAIGTNYATMTILINDNNNINTQSGTTYVNSLITSGNSSLNNVSLNTSPILSYTTLPTYASNQIGYSVPVNYTIGTALSSGVFKIIATSDILPIGNYNVYWTTHANFTGASGNITVGQYGVVFSNTIPLGLSGSSLIENHNQTAYYLHNQVYTSSAYVSPSTTGYKMYLGIWATFATVIITPTNLSNLQVIRTS